VVKSNNSKTKPIKCDIKIKGKYPFTVLIFLSIIVYGMFCVFSKEINFDWSIIVLLIITVILDIGFKNGK